MIAGCSSCGDGATEVAKIMQAAYAEQTELSKTLATQNIALQIDASAAEGIAENIDISV